MRNVTKDWRGRTVTTGASLAVYIAQGLSVHGSPKSNTYPTKHGLLMFGSVRIPDEPRQYVCTARNAYIRSRPPAAAHRSAKDSHCRSVYNEAGLELWQAVLRSCSARTAHTCTHATAAAIPHRHSPAYPLLPLLKDGRGRPSRWRRHAGPACNLKWTSSRGVHPGRLQQC